MGKIGVLVFIICIFLLYPFFDFVYAQDIDPSIAKEGSLLFSPLEQNILFGLIQQEFTNSDFYLWDIEKQAALFSTRIALRDKNISFLPGFVTTETIKVVLSTASLVRKISEQSIKAVLDELETKSVKMAVDYATDWLFQNNIKRTSGNLGDEMQYVMVVDSSKNSRGRLILDVFSSNYTDPPSGGAGWGYTNPYPGLPKGEKLHPFVLRFDVDILSEEKIEFLSVPNIEISFPDEVPRLELAKELPYSIEEQKINFLNKLTTIKQILDGLGNAGIEFANTLGRGVGIIKDTTENFFSFISRVISLGGAGLIDPFQQESLGLDAVEVQLNLVKEQLEVKENQSKLSLAKDEAKDEVQPVGNLARLSFPQEEQLLPPKLELSETKELLDTTIDQVILSEAKDICEINISSTAPMALGGVIINEVAWMGTSISGNDEWIEIHNKSSDPISLEGWKLLDKDMQIEIVFGSSHNISSNGFFLLERTDDTTVLNTEADFIYTGALSNTNEALYLFDNNCILRDKVEANPDWLAGDNTNKKSMERNNHNLEWYTYDGQSFGSPRQTNGRDMLLDYRPLVSTVFLPGISGGGGPSLPVVVSDCQAASININLASAENLEMLYGIGPVLAQSIIDEREIKLFSSIDDLVRVSGIAEGKVSSIKEQGCAFVDLEEIDEEEQGLDPEPELEPESEPEPESELESESELEPEPEPEPELEDTTLPEISFNALASTQENVYFTLSWIGEDPVGEIEPSGIDKFYLQYSVTLNADGTFLQYEENSAWQNWQQSQAGELILDSVTSSISLWGQDGISYNFQVKAKDVVGNESVLATTQAQLGLIKSVVINEIAWMGTNANSSDEWLEFFNAGEEEINLLDWSIYGANTGECLNFADADNFDVEETNSQFLISPGEYLLYGNDPDVAKDQNNNSLVDVWDATIGLNNSSPGMLQMYNQADCVGVVIDEANRTDGDWLKGDNVIKQSMERIDTAKAGSDTANWASNNLITHNGEDADDNYINGTPGQRNSVSLNATVISSLRLNEFDSITLTKLGSPYSAVSLIVSAGKTLTIEPGVEIEFKNNRGYLRVEGTLTAIGESENQIILTSDSGSNWCGLRFTSTSTNSELNYTVIEKSASGGAGCGGDHYSIWVEESDITIKNSTIVSGNSHLKLRLKNSNSFIDNLIISGAAQYAWSSAIYIEGGSPIIQNSTISNSSIGIWSNGGLSTPTIQNNTFTNNTYPVKLNSSGAALSGNTATENTYNGIFVEGQVYYTDVIWQADTMPYILNQFTVNESKTLTIEAGAEVQFIDKPYSGPELSIKGTLLAQGDVDNLVTFTKGPSTSYWKRIHFTSTSTSSILSYVQVSYGGSALGTIGALYIEGEVDLQNVTIQNSPYVGIYSLGTLTGSHITIITPADNTYAFRLAVAQCPAFTNVTISGSGQNFYPGSLECIF